MTSPIVSMVYGLAGGDYAADHPMGVVPVLVGPLQALLALLPAVLMALGGVLVSILSPRGLLAFLRFLWKERPVTLPLVAVVVLWPILFSVSVLQGVLLGPLLFLLGLILYGVIWNPVRQASHLKRLKILSYPVGCVAAALPFFLYVVLTGDLVLFERARGGRTSVVEATALPWPMFRGGPLRRGAVPGAPDPVQGGIQWANTQVSKTFWSSPCVVGNRVYAVSADKGPMRDRGAILCLDADTGALIWQSRPRRYLATFSSPSVSGKYLVVGEGLHFTKNARIICLDVEKNGTVLWTFETQSHVESSPAIDGDRVYIGAGDDGYYCLALEPDKNGQARVLWHREYADAETSPVFHDGKVYVGLGIGGNAIVCLDREDGGELWRLETPYPVFGPPTIAGGKLFIGMGNGNFVETAEQVWAKEYQKLRDAGASRDEIAQAQERFKPIGEIWCVDLATREVEWKFRAGRVVLGAIATDGERLYFGSRDHQVYAISMAGELIATWNARAPILTSPALAQDHVYVVTQAGTLFALNRETLDPIGWERQLGITGLFLSSPAVARGHVYVGTDTEGLVCVGEPRAGAVVPVWAGRLGGPGRSGWLDASAVGETGSYSWRIPEGDISPDTPPISAPVMALDRSLYIGVQSAERTGLVRLDLADDPGQKPTEAWFTATGLPVADTAAVGEAVFAVTGRKSGDSMPGARPEGGANRSMRSPDSRRLLCLDAATGAERWARPIAEGASGRLLATREALYVVDRETGLTALELGAAGDAAERWRAEVGACVGGPVLANGHLVVTVRGKSGDSMPDARSEGGDSRSMLSPDFPALVALDPASGAVRWRWPLPSEPTTGPVFENDMIAVGSADGVTAHAFVNGAQLWSAPVGAVEGDLVCDRNRLACTTAAGELVLVDWLNGAVQARLAGVERRLAPILTRDVVLYATEASIQRYAYNAPPEEARRWMLTSWMGRITAPMVQVKSHVFVPTAGRGLVCAKPKR